MRSFTLDPKPALAGLAFIAIAVLFLVYAFMTLDLGTARNMGPAYFPVVLAGLLALLGLVALASAVGRNSGAPRDLAPVRALALVLACPVVFALAVEPLGMILSVMMVTGMTAAASRRMSVRTALILMVALPLFCVVVFKYGLGVPLPLFGDLMTDTFGFLPRF